MSQSPTLVTNSLQSGEESLINNFCITFSTVNGSGSATANSTLLRAIFKMGIPVSGKNIFPSNIQGLPTWYTIRVSKDGFEGRVEKDDIVVAMNASSILNELKYLVPGGVLFYADDIKVSIDRTDIIKYPMPVKQILRQTNAPDKLRDYMANMVYVGIVAQSLGVSLDKIYHALDFHFKGKQKPIDSNFEVIKTAFDWAKENLKKQDGFRVESMDATSNCIMADGNTACALGAIYGGVQFVGWYPITPATTLPEALNEYLPLLRKDPETGKDTYVVVQAEDELAAIGMAIGAGWAGLRSMTATSGPGLSLMAEYLGLAYYTEVPVVVFDVQRVGPSTGLPTRTAQGDITFSYFISHGDKQYVLLFPGSIKECFEFGWKAFDIAERLQTPVIVLTDLDLGMNNWMADKFEYPDREIDRGKVLWEEDLEEILKRQNGKWGRYLDIDGDGICYRTVAGNKHPRSGYFARGTGRDEYTRYNEDPEVWERMLNRIKLKFETAKRIIPNPIIKSMQDAEIGIISFGSADPAVEEARHLLAQTGTPTDYLRVRAIPFDDSVYEFIKNHQRTYVVELNRDGQMKQLLTIENPEYANHLRKVSHIDGLPLSAQWIKDQIQNQEGK